LKGGKIINTTIEKIKENIKAPSNNGTASFLTLCGFLGISVTPEQLSHTLAFGEEGMDEVLMLRAAAELGLKARLGKIKTAKLKKMPLPAIGRNKNGNFFILAKVVENKAVVFLSGNKPPKFLSFGELEDYWNGNLLFLKNEKSEKTEIKFGFRWFIPTILKYKKRPSRRLCKPPNWCRITSIRRF